MECMTVTVIVSGNTEAAEARKGRIKWKGINMGKEHLKEGRKEGRKVKLKNGKKGEKQRGGRKIGAEIEGNSPLLAVILLPFAIATIGQSSPPLPPVAGWLAKRIFCRL